MNFILGDEVSPRKSNLSSVRIESFLQLLYNNSTERTMYNVFLWIILLYLFKNFLNLQVSVNVLNFFLNNFVSFN